MILVRFVDEKWNIQQRVVKLMLLAKSLTGEEVAHQLIGERAKRARHYQG